MLISYLRPRQTSRAVCLIPPTESRADREIARLQELQQLGSSSSGASGNAGIKIGIPINRRDHKIAGKAQPKSAYRHLNDAQTPCQNLDSKIRGKRGGAMQDYGRRYGNDSSVHEPSRQ